MKLYAYCLTEGLNSLASSPRGINDAAVYVAEVNDFSLLVSDFAGDNLPVSRDNVLAHAAVVGSVLDRTTPLPFRFGTIATQPQLESYLGARHESLASRLKLVRGCVEMGVKIIWDREWTEASPDEKSAERPGTHFLEDKRRAILGGEARVEAAKSVAAWLAGALCDLVRDTRLAINPTDKLLVAAAHLVRRDSIDEYRARLKQARLERAELYFLASGPWPPYSFANIDLEFKTQFGVS